MYCLLSAFTLAYRQELSMRYVMKQKLFAFGDDFTIQDAGGNDCYYVDGAAFSFGDSLSFQDMQGNKLASINQRLMTIGSTYDLHRDGQLMATVSKQWFTFFAARFLVDVPGPDDLEAEGSFLEHEYTFKRGRKTVARVSKQWFSWSDTYGVDVADGEDDILILASSVVIDLVCHQKKN